MVLKKIAALTPLALLSIGLYPNFALANGATKTVEFTITCEVPYRFGRFCKDERSINADTAAGDGYVFLPHTISHVEVFGMGDDPECSYKFDKYVRVSPRTSLPTRITISTSVGGSGGMTQCIFTVTAKKQY